MAQFPEKPRIPKGVIGSLATNYLHLRNPYTIAWWSAALPGFGHLSLGSYVSGFLLFFWEMFVNTKAHLNVAILYSFTGRFDMAREVVDGSWLLFYPPLFIFAVWDSYRRTLQLNRLSLLADRAGQTVGPVNVSLLEINVLDKRSPWVAVVWTLLMPGLGHLYTHRVIAGFFLLAWYIVIGHYSFLLPAAELTAAGAFEQAKQAIDPGWFLFLPSIYGFGAYDAYVNTVGYNRLFEKEQAAYLRKTYQGTDLKMPVKVEAPVYIVAAFEHSVELELALTELEQKGIPAGHIRAIPLNAPRKDIRFFDTIHNSDGISMFDLPAALGTIFMLFGVIGGFMWQWGPIIWGLIGLFLGAALGFTAKYLHYRLYAGKQPASPRVAEMVVIVGCQPAEAEMVERVLAGHLALSIGRAE